MISLILAAVLAQADGGLASMPATDAAADAGIYSLCPERGSVWAVDGGTLVSDQQGRRLNCIMDACDFRVKELEQAIAEPPPLYKAFVVVGVAIAAGFVSGYVCARAHCL